MSFCEEWDRYSDEEWAEIQRWEKLEDPGYHIRKIPRGTFGEVSKIREELAELEDALAQGVKIMALCELSDLYGAVRAVAENLGVTMNDLEKMSDVTSRAFESGRRISRDASTKQTPD
jgi:hypothetical protein